MRPYDAIICSKITNNFSFMVHQLTFMHKTMNWQKEYQKIANLC